MEPEVNIESSLEAFLEEDPTLAEDEVVEQEEKPKEEPKDEPEETEADSEEAPEEEPEEDSGDDESEEEGEQEEPESSDLSDDTLLDITIGDEEYEVNLAELKSGYLRNEDYVTKVQAQEAAYNEKLAALEVRESELAEELRIASVAMLGDLSRYERVNWTALKEQDPEQYKSIRLEYIEAQERVQQANARRQGIEKMHQEAQALRHQAYLASQMELAEKLVPGFKEPATRDAILKHALSLGYTQEDVMSICDARHLLLLNNSRQLAEGVVRKKEALDNKRPAQKLPPVVKPGQAVAKSSVDRKAVRQASARLNTEKSVDAAAALLMTFDL